jgi:hypothetical protein
LALRLDERWPNLTVADRRRIISACVERVTVAKVAQRIGRGIDPDRVTITWRV